MDLGMGTGKVALQAYFEHPNLKTVVGIEFARSRWLIGKNALHRLVREFPEEFSFSDEEDSRGDRDDSCCCSIVNSKGRMIKFRKGNMFHVTTMELGSADVVILQYVAIGVVVDGGKQEKCY